MRNQAAWAAAARGDRPGAPDQVGDREGRPLGVSGSRDDAGGHGPGAQENRPEEMMFKALEGRLLADFHTISTWWSVRMTAIGALLYPLLISVQAMPSDVQAL